MQRLVDWLCAARNRADPEGMFSPCFLAPSLSHAELNLEFLSFDTRVGGSYP